MKEQNKRIIVGVVSIILILTIFSVWNKKNVQKQPDTTTQVTQTSGQTRKDIEEMKLKSATNDTIVDFFVDGLTDEELLTATENIDNSFTPYSFEANGAITTNF